MVMDKMVILSEIKNPDNKGKKDLLVKTGGLPRADQALAKIRAGSPVFPVARAVIREVLEDNRKVRAAPPNRTLSSNLVVVINNRAGLLDKIPSSKIPEDPLGGHRIHFSRKEVLNSNPNLLNSKISSSLHYNNLNNQQADQVADSHLPEGDRADFHRLRAVDRVVVSSPPVALAAVFLLQEEDHSPRLADQVVANLRLHHPPVSISNF